MRKFSKEISNTREHPKTLRLAKPNIIFSKGNSNGYDGRMEDKNDRVNDDAQKECVNGNKNLSDHHRRVIINNKNINGENIREESHNEENNVNVNNEQGRMNSMLQHNLLYNLHDVNLPPQTYRTAPLLAVTNSSF